LQQIFDSFPFHALSEFPTCIAPFHVLTRFPNVCIALPKSRAHSAFVIEAVADQQKAASKADPATKDLWTEIGLWRYCRQPNYFGEMAGYESGFLEMGPLETGLEVLCSVLFLRRLLSHFHYRGSSVVTFGTLRGLVSQL
jgi:hypothetical protein